LPSADDASGYRSVEEPHALLAQGSRQRARLGRVRRAHIDQQRAGRHRVEQPFVEHDLAHDLRVREDQDHRSGARRHRRDRRHHVDAGVTRRRFPRDGVDVERRDPEARSSEAGRHRPAHVAETYEADRISGPHTPDLYTAGRRSRR